MQFFTTALKSPSHALTCLWLVLKIVLVFGVPTETSSPTNSSLNATANTTYIITPSSTFASSPRPLTIGGYFPINGTCWTGGLATKVAVEMAIRQVNARRDVLSGYELIMDARDTKCDPGVGLHSLYDHIYNEPTKIMLLGAAFSPVTQPLAEVAKYWNLVQVSYGSTSPALKNRALYPRFFRTISSDLAFNPARVALMKAFAWKRVATIHQNEASGIFSEAIQNLHKELATNNITLITAESFTDDPGNHLANIKKKDARIIIGNFYEEAARRVFCEAYKQGMFGKAYVWLIIGWYPDKWWERRLVEEDITCTVEQMREAVDSHLATDSVKLNEDDRTASQPTISGWLAADYAKEFTKLTGKDARLESSFAYDALWVMALALNTSAEWLNTKQGDSMTLEHFTYEDKDMADMFTKAMYETSFLGVTGPVSFTKDGERIGLIQIEQLQEDENKVVGVYESGSNTIEMNKHNPIKWLGNGPPKDRTITVNQIKSVSVGLYAFMATLAALGIILACLFLAVNIMYREKRLIKMSSPRLNNLIISGCIMTYFSVFLFGLDYSLVNPSVLGDICQTRAWTMSLGFTLAFGAMFAKTWRVHAIFKSITPRKKVIRDEHLFLLVGVFVFVDVCLLALWTAVDPMTRTLKTFSDQMYIKDDKQVIPALEYCTSSNMVYWLGALYAYNALMLVFGAFLAWETRHVTIPVLNDSKFIGMSVYNVVVLSTVGVAVTAVIEGNPDATFAITAVFIIFCTTITLCLVFIPKILKIIAGDTEGKDTTTNRNKSSNPGNPASGMGSTSTSITQENSNLKKTMAEKERHLMELKRLLEAVGSRSRNNSLSLDTARAGSQSTPSRRRSHSRRETVEESLSTDCHVNHSYENEDNCSTVHMADVQNSTLCCRDIYENTV